MSSTGMSSTGKAAGVAVEDVRFAYGATTILDGVSLSVAPGEFFAFLGPSGSGKTTLLRLIAGFGTPSTGRVLVGGRDVTQAPPWARDVGMVFQTYALWPHMTVAENVAFGLHRRKVARAEVKRRTEAALALVGLEAFGGRRPAQLSGGQQQRVALARTVVIEPAVLLLDEPLSNLDAGLRVEMRAELRALQRKTGLTTIFVTHDQEEANAIADRMAVLDGGRIQQIGTPVELYDRPANRFVARFLGTANLVEGAVLADGTFQAQGGFTLALSGMPRPGKAALGLRPHALALCPPAGPGALPGRVVQAEFLGSQVRYAVEVAGIRLAVDAPHRLGQAPLGPGDAVGIGIDASQVVLLR